MTPLEDLTLENKTIDYEDGDVVIDLLNTFTKNIKTWHADLRKGATDELQNVVLDMVQHKVDDCKNKLQDSTPQETRASMLKTLKLLSPVLKLFTISAAKDTLQTCINLEATWLSKDRASELEILSKGSFNFVDEVVGGRTICNLRLLRDK
jgi:hypothetical protein